MLALRRVVSLITGWTTTFTTACTSAVKTPDILLLDIAQVRSIIDEEAVQVAYLDRYMTTSLRQTVIKKRYVPCSLHEYVDNRIFYLASTISEPEDAIRSCQTIARCMLRQAPGDPDRYQVVDQARRPFLLEPSRRLRRGGSYLFRRSRGKDAYTGCFDDHEQELRDTRRLQDRNSPLSWFGTLQW